MRDMNVFCYVPLLDLFLKRGQTAFLAVDQEEMPYPFVVLEPIHENLFVRMG